MISRRIFKKRKSTTKIKFFFLFIFFLSIYIFYITTNKNKSFIIIPENEQIFYIIPEDKGGENVANLDKKSLNLNIQKENYSNINKPIDLLYSIQFYTNNDLEKVINYLKRITDNEERIYNLEDFYILRLNSEIGTEYFLIYKNFKSKIEAKNYCLNFLVKIENCLIVDTTKF